MLLSFVQGDPESTYPKSHKIEAPAREGPATQVATLQQVAQAGRAHTGQTTT